MFWLIWCVRSALHIADGCNKDVYINLVCASSIHIIDDVFNKNVYINFRNQVTNSMAGVVKAMESAMKSMNLEKVVFLKFCSSSLFHGRNYRPNFDNGFSIIIGSWRNGYTGYKWAKGLVNLNSMRSLYDA